LIVISALKFMYVTTSCYLASCAWLLRVVPCAHVAVHRLAVAAMALPRLGRSSRTARPPVRYTPDRPCHRDCRWCCCCLHARDVSTPLPLPSYRHAVRLALHRTASLARFDATRTRPCHRRLTIYGTTTRGSHRQPARGRWLCTRPGLAATAPRRRHILPSHA